VFKTKQLRSYRDYIRSIRSQPAAAQEVAEESQSDIDNFEVSTLNVDEEVANYVGEELTHVAALAALPAALPDTPLDVVTIEEDADAKPEFAISCSLASKLLGAS
jgi:hypothetical protein